jgi:hypothetical protein
MERTGVLNHQTKGPVYSGPFVFPVWHSEIVNSSYERWKELDEHHAPEKGNTQAEQAASKVHQVAFIA